MRGFIDDARWSETGTAFEPLKSQSAFVRGFIDDLHFPLSRLLVEFQSQSAFVRGFIDDARPPEGGRVVQGVSIRVRARLHR